jgi:hypothetical protein
LAQAATLSGNRDVLEQAATETAVFTCVTDGKVAEVFSHRSQDGQYYQSLVARESLLDYPNRGRELIRNTQDYARSKSYEPASLLGADLDREEEKGEEEEEEEEKGVARAMKRCGGSQGMGIFLVVVRAKGRGILLAVGEQSWPLAQATPWLVLQVKRLN